MESVNERIYKVARFQSVDVEKRAALWIKKETKGQLLQG